MRRIVSFGGYTFPTIVPIRGEVLRTNFANGVGRTSRLPGMMGGYDEYGADSLPAEIGNVRFRFALVADTPSAMASARDAVMRLATIGRAALTAEMPDGSTRWTWAKVTNISLPTAHDTMSERMSEVTIDWQVAYPRWFSTAAGSPVTIAGSGALTEGTVTNAGTADAVPIITIDPGTAIGAGGITIRRMVSGSAVDEVVYAAALASTDVLSVNCKELTVAKNGVDAYGTAFSALHPAWLRLAPGANTVRVILGVGETANVSIAWDDTWV